MHRYRMLGPNGPMETVAKSLDDAWGNLRYRLVHEYGMSWYDAVRYDHSDLKAVD